MSERGDSIGFVRSCSSYFKVEIMSQVLVADVAVEVSTQDRWKDAIRVLRASGVRVRQNVQGCCRSCMTEDKLGLKSPDEAYAYTYGGQGGAYTWQDDVAVYRDTVGSRRYRSPKVVGSVYFNHGNGSGARIAQAFTQAGFTVDWDGSESQCVTVVF